MARGLALPALLAAGVRRAETCMGALSPPRRVAFCWAPSVSQSWQAGIEVLRNTYTYTISYKVENKQRQAAGID